uniref:Uncharacterized protein n=1 Tax=Trichogramma kaykai TaxID=54128 RepID=A0ABD2VVC5_9HYME
MTQIFSNRGKYFLLKFCLKISKREILLAVYHKRLSLTAAAGGRAHLEKPERKWRKKMYRFTAQNYIEHEWLFRDYQLGRIRYFLQVKLNCGSTLAAKSKVSAFAHSEQIRCLPSDQGLPGCTTRSVFAGKIASVGSLSRTVGRLASTTKNKLNDLARDRELLRTLAFLRLFKSVLTFT